MIRSEATANEFLSQRPTIAEERARWAKVLNQPVINRPVKKTFWQRILGVK